MKIKSPALLLFAAVLLLSPLSLAEVRLNEPTTVTFASVEQGQEVLGARDEFVQRLSPFDRATRLKTDSAVSEKEFLGFVKGSVRAWGNQERELLEPLLTDIAARLEPFSLSFPKTILLVRTTGEEEGNAPYTRGNAIVLPAKEFTKDPVTIKKDLCHEFFHILSRTNPELRERLYGVIGFEQCEELAFPPQLASRKITNPDAPRNDHFIRLRGNGGPSLAVPILFSGAEKYDPKKGGEFFRYMQFRFLLVEKRDGSSKVEPLDEGGQPRLIDPKNVSGFFEQVGKNTRYIIHPEEILADNFALLVIGEQRLASPEIVEKMRKILLQR